MNGKIATKIAKQIYELHEVYIHIQHDIKIYRKDYIRNYITIYTERSLPNINGGKTVCIGKQFKSLEALDKYLCDIVGYKPIFKVNK